MYIVPGKESAVLAFPTARYIQRGSRVSGDAYIYIRRGSPLGYSDGVSAAERLCEFFVDPCQRIVSHSARVCVYGSFFSGFGAVYFWKDGIGCE